MNSHSRASRGRMRLLVRLSYSFRDRVLKRVGLQRIGVQANRWQRSPESSLAGSRTNIMSDGLGRSFGHEAHSETVEPFTFRHNNMEWRACVNITPPESLFDIRIPTLAELPGDVPDQDALLSTSPTTPSRPLIDEPRGDHALRLVDISPEDNLSVNIESFPQLPLNPAATKSTQLPFTVEDVVDAQNALQDDSLPLRILPVEHRLTIRNASSNLDVDSQPSSNKPVETPIIRKPVPLRAASPKSHASDSIENLQRYNQPTDGDPPTLPDVKRISSLLDSLTAKLLELGLGNLQDGQGLLVEIQTTHATDPVTEDEPASTINCVVEDQHPTHTSITTIPQKAHSVFLPECPHPQPLRSNAVPLVEESYSRYLSSGAPPPPLPPRNPCRPSHMHGPRRRESIAERRARRGPSQRFSTEDSLPVPPTARPGDRRHVPLFAGSRKRLPTSSSSPLARDDGLMPPATPVRECFSPLTREDAAVGSPDLRGEGYRYPGFAPSEGRLRVGGRAVGRRRRGGGCEVGRDGRWVRIREV